jgi:hypothetical protein
VNQNVPAEVRGRRGVLPALTRQDEAPAAATPGRFLGDLGCSPRSAQGQDPASRARETPGSICRGQPANGSIKFTNNDWPLARAGQNLRAAIGVWQWQTGGNNQVFPKTLATHEPVAVPLPGWDKR